MSFRALAATALCSALPLAAAQQNSMPDMPGMNMQQPPPKPATVPKPLQMPADLRKPSPTDPAADAASRSLQQSEQQQRRENTPAGPGSDAGSLTRAASTLQEPENPTLHTGATLPTPELLGDLASRPPLSLEQLQDWADHTNPSLAEARATVVRSIQQARQAGLPPNPSIGYSGEHIRGGSYGGGEQGAFVSQTVVLGGKLALRRNIYRQQAASDSVALDEQHFRVRNDLQQAFYNTLAAERTADLRGRLLQVASDAAATTHRLSNLGQADAPDILQAEVEAEQASVDYVAAQRMVLQQFSILAALAGKPDLPVSRLAGDLEQTPDLDAEARVREIVAESPSTRHARQEVTLAEARLHSAKREPIPDLKLQAGEWYSGEYLEGLNRGAGWMGFATAGIDLPLWNRNQGNTAAATAEIERARQDVTRTELMLRQQAEPLAQQYLSARFMADRYRTELLPRAHRAYELYTMKYQQMAAAYPQVLVSQRTLFQLQIGYLEALRSEWATAISLQNFTLTGGLAQPMTTGTAETSINLPSGGGTQ